MGRKSVPARRVDVPKNEIKAVGQVVNPELLHRFLAMPPKDFCNAFLPKHRVDLCKITGFVQINYHGVVGAAKDSIEQAYVTAKKNMLGNVPLDLEKLASMPCDQFCQLPFFNVTEHRIMGSFRGKKVDTWIGSHGSRYYKCKYFILQGLNANGEYVPHLKAKTFASLVEGAVAYFLRKTKQRTEMNHAEMLVEIVNKLDGGQQFKPEELEGF